MNNILPQLKLKYEAGNFERIQLTDTQKTRVFAYKLFNQDTIEYTEEFITIFLNNNNQTIGYTRVDSGSIGHCTTDIRVLLTTALTCGATGIVVAHNHPGGSLNFSKADVEFTKALNEACKTVMIQLLDHVLVVKGSAVSYVEEKGKL